MVLAPGYLWGLAGIPTDGRAYGAEGNPIPASWGISKTSKRGWTNLSCPVRGRDFFRNTKDAGGIKTLYRHMLSLSFEYVPVNIPARWPISFSWKCQTTQSRRKLPPQGAGAVNAIGKGEGYPAAQTHDGIKSGRNEPSRLVYISTMVTPVSPSPKVPRR